MINSLKLQTPSTTKGAIGGNIPSTIVDSGIRYGIQEYTLFIQNLSGIKAADVLTVDIDGTTYSAVFNTDADTTMDDFITDILTEPLVASATRVGDNIVVQIVPNVEVVVDAAGVTNSTVTFMYAEETKQLHIVQALVVLNQDAVQPLRTEVTGVVPNTVTYAGYALPGSSPALAVWKIQKITETATTKLIEYADGNENMDNIWNDRASLTYA